MRATSPLTSLLGSKQTRVVGVDVQVCFRCEGATRVVTIPSDPADIADVLEGRPRPRVPPRARARPAVPGQLRLAFDTPGAP